MSQLNLKINNISKYDVKFILQLCKLFRKFKLLEKVIKAKALANKQNQQIIYIFLAILRHGQDFLQKLPKLVNIRNVCIVYLLNFGTQFFTSLKYLFGK